MSKLKDFSRRRFLRGAGKFMLPLPFLECFLNSNGTAYAQGQSLQSIYVSMLNGLSSGGGGVSGPQLGGAGYQDNMKYNLYFPLKFGKSYTFTNTLKPLEKHRNDFNLVTNLEIGRGDNSEGAFSAFNKNITAHHLSLIHI